MAEAAVRLIREMRRFVDEEEHKLIGGWRAAGLTWLEIGELYGISEQGMYQRFARLESRLSALRTEAGAGGPEAAAGRSGSP